jgi:hypothetical protein
MDEFAGIYLKLDRAQEHFDSLDAEIREFLEANPAETFAQESADGTFLLRVGRLEPLPLRWGVLVGDLVHDTRSSLEHMAHQLVLANGGTPDFRTAFPICFTEELWNKRVADRRLRNSPLAGMASDARALIRELQPFVGRTENEARVTMLAGLESLWNADKHRLVHVAHTATNGYPAEVLVNPGPPLTEVELQTFEPDIELREGMILGKVKLKHHRLAINEEVELTLRMNLTVGFRGHNADPVASMHFLASAIVDTRQIVQRFEPLLS